MHFDQLCAQNDLIEKSSNQKIITLNILHFAEMKMTLHTAHKNYIKKLKVINTDGDSYDCILGSLSICSPLNFQNFFNVF